jgi:hypothetical protein
VGKIVLMALAALGLMAGGAAAQDWFSAEACRVGPAAVDRAVYPEAVEARIAALAAEVPNPVGRLWEITAPGGQVSHLWGTYHTPDPQLLALPEALMAVIGAARVVALEFDPVPDSRDEVARAYDSDWMWAHWGLPAPDRREIPAEVMFWIEERLIAIGWGAEYIDQMSDAGLVTLLLGDPCADFLGEVLPGQDQYIGQLAYLAGAEVTGLEQPEDFGLHLTDPTRAAQARATLIYYASFLGPETALPGGRETSYALYLQGRLAELDLWSNDWLASVLGAPRARDVVAVMDSYILVERNGFFTLAARPLLDEGGALLAVGAAHLPGEMGMVEMLRDAGYKVERVVLPGEPDQP